ncbi:AraC-type DNA-binding protein [Robiginitalea myxolifaciens]|uniref:AraC-type DNA-binding protein n=1 Tax=Robiginitalea myxolifaciens TaxID=400055 RepID=A0A1I6FVK5_9FLAO|nr:helix-turn-helix domain-containing protein [Robiginitalea myxolifaciens]SFR33995.1 AraC-type DNA-binding protein [Robiginitalea myxolifaciens]
MEHLTYPGVGILIVLMVFILAKKRKIPSDWWLFVVLLAIGIKFVGFILPYDYTIWTYCVQSLTEFYFFPLLLIYGLVLISPNQKFKPVWLWSFSLAVLFTLFLFYDMGISKKTSTSEQIKEIYEAAPPKYLLFYIAHYVYQIVLLIWFLFRLKGYTLSLKGSFSNIDNINMRWLGSFTKAYLFTICLAMTITLLRHLKQPSYEGLLSYLFYLSLTIALFYVCFHGIRHYAIADFKAIGAHDSGHKETFEKYKSSSLTEEKMNKLYHQIKKLIEDEQWFLKPQLRIDDLAKELQVTINQVSQTINSKAEKSFYDFVNSYRVAYLKNELIKSENQQYTILALGLESGFNSKSSLNRIFKESTGLTPLQFQRINMHSA